MDKTLVKILNMATSGSHEESTIAIEQAYQFMKKRDLDLEDVQFDSLYNGDVVAIRLIYRFSQEIPFHKDQGVFIQTWVKKTYGSNPAQQGRPTQHNIFTDIKKNDQLERELKRVRSLSESMKRECESTKKIYEHTRAQLDYSKKLYEQTKRELELIKQKHSNRDSEREQLNKERDELKIKLQETRLILQKTREKNATDNEFYKHMIHAKVLQITNIKEEFKNLLSELRYKMIYT
ncbi:MAG: hypothetical protein HQL67_08090 [Magnetococcales bacterium]|nr:hypothetical protein [Magnetococcales bacterium]